MFNDEQLYVAYKWQWIAEHISDEVMTATETSYENNENAKDMTLHEYVENYGFADGSCYADFEEFRDNELEDFQEQTKALFALDDLRVYAADKTACKAMEAVIFHTHCRKPDSEELQYAEKDFRENGEKSRYSEKEITELSHDVEKENENPFIEEVVYELKETHDAGVESPKMNVTVYAKGDEVMDILNKVAHDEDYLEILENAKIRLSEYSFGITPETTMVFPTSMVETVHGAEDYIRDCGEISVEYDAPTLVQENLNDVRDYIEKQNQNHDMQKG